jgi:pimeloyl-ACP methyl ester carboxylesterase
MYTITKTMLAAVTFCLLLHADRPDLNDAKQEKPAAKGIEGIWLGTLKVGAVELRLVFHVSRKPDGAYTATMDSLDQGAKGIPLDEASLKDKTVRFEFKKGMANFEGTLKAGGAEISGDWKQGGASFPLVLKHADKEPVISRPQDPKPPYPYLEEEVVYENKKAGVKLAGTLTKPRGAGPFAAALLITGSGPQDRNEALLGHKPFLVLADYLTRRGLAVLRVDDRGVGKSTGVFGTATTEDFAQDVEAGVEFLNGRPDIDSKRIGLIGHSEGGIIAPMLAARSRDIAFIVLMAGTGLTGEEVLYLQGAAIVKAMGLDDAAVSRQKAVQQAMLQVVKQEKDNSAAEKKIHEALDALLAKASPEEKKEADKSKGALEGQIKRTLSPWFRFFIVFDPASALQKVKCPVLALNGEKDTQVLPKENLEAIEKALKAGGNQDYTIKLLPGLNHLFQTCKTGAPAEYGKIEETIAPAALQLIGDWILKHTALRP